MRATVNATATHRGAAGIGRYAANVAHSLVKHARDVDVVLLARDGSEFEQQALPDSVTLIRCRPTGPMWEQLQIPSILERHQVDVYHSPLFMAPIVRACRQIVTIHDVIPEKFPQQTPADFLRLHRQYSGPCLRAADAVLTVSEYSKRDITETVALDGKEVHVAYQAISEQFCTQTAQPAVDAVRRKLNLPHIFVLYVGSIEPRKNTFRLIDSFAVLSQKRGDVSLVLAGRRLFKDYDAEAYAAAQGVADRVRYLGYVADEDLPGLYASAELLAFPSGYEGFGLPVAEALACGCPVVSADNSSLPEAGGEAAVYADPEDPEAFAEAMLRLLEDADERGRRAQLGLEHVKKFTRRKFAQRLLSVYRQVLEGD